MLDTRCLSRKGSLSCHTYCDMGLWLLQSHSKDRHPRHKVGFESPTHGSCDLCVRCSRHCATRLTLSAKHSVLKSWDGFIFSFAYEVSPPPPSKKWRKAASLCVVHDAKFLSWGGGGGGWWLHYEKKPIKLIYSLFDNQKRQCYVIKWFVSAL